MPVARLPKLHAIHSSDPFLVPWYVQDAQWRPSTAQRTHLRTALRAHASQDAGPSITCTRGTPSSITWTRGTPSSITKTPKFGFHTLRSIFACENVLLVDWADRWTLNTWPECSRIQGRVPVQYSTGKKTPGEPGHTRDTHGTRGRSTRAHGTHRQTSQPSKPNDPPARPRDGRNRGRSTSAGQARSRPLPAADYSTVPVFSPASVALAWRLGAPCLAPAPCSTRGPS